MTEYSVSVAGEKFAIPQKDEYDAEFNRIEALVETARSEGKEIVVVGEEGLKLIVRKSNHNEAKGD